MMMTFYLAAPVFGCCCCYPCWLTDALSHRHGSQGHFRGTDSSLMLLVAPVLFLLWQVKMSPATLEHSCRSRFIKNIARRLSVDWILLYIFCGLSVTLISVALVHCIWKHSQKSSIFLFASYWLLQVLFVLKCRTIGLNRDNLSSGYLNIVVWVERRF